MKSLDTPPPKYRFERSLQVRLSYVTAKPRKGLRSEHSRRKAVGGVVDRNACSNTTWSQVIHSRFVV